MKCFINKLIILCLILAILVYGVNYAFTSRSINYGTMAMQKNDSSYIKDVPSHIQICNFGNSHGYYGFNYSSCDEYVSFNFALPSQSLSYDYRILQNYQNCIESGAIVFICLSYASFFGENETKDLNFDSKNRRYYYFLEDRFIKEYDMKTDIFMNYFPALISPLTDLVETIIGVSSVEDIWSYSTTQQAAEEHGLRRYEQHVKNNVDDKGNRVINEEEIDSLYQIIELCKSLGATPILVTTPYLSEYTDAVKANDKQFYDDFYNIIDKVKVDTNVKYYDYQFDDRFIDSYDLFLNSDHLNRQGAEKFTEIIMQEIKKEGYIK